MFDLIIKLAVAAAGLFAANEAVRAVTGKSLFEHMDAWWNQVLSDLADWVAAHPSSKVRRLIASVACTLDDARAAAASLVRVAVKAETKEGGLCQIAEYDLPLEAVLEEFPELEQRTEIELTNRIGRRS